MFTLNPEEIKRNDYYSTCRYKEMKRMITEYELDTNREKRIQDLECKSCYYLRNCASFQAFTNYNCQNCDSKQTWHNGDSPRYCDVCSIEYIVCKRCGADLENQ